MLVSSSEKNFLFKGTSYDHIIARFNRSTSIVKQLSMHCKDKLHKIKGTLKEQYNINTAMSHQ